MADDLKLMNITGLARELGIDRHTASRMVRTGVIPPAYVDDNDRPWFSRATIEAHQRRTGEVHAERVAS